MFLWTSDSKLNNTVTLATRNLELQQQILPGTFTVHAWNMATALPTFPEFDANETSCKMAEMALAIQKPAFRNECDKQAKTVSSVTALCSRSHERDFWHATEYYSRRRWRPVRQSRTSADKLLHSQAESWVLNLCFPSCQVRKQRDYFSVSHKAKAVGSHPWVWWCGSWNQDPNCPEL